MAARWHTSGSRPGEAAMPGRSGGSFLPAWLRAPQRLAAGATAAEAPAAAEGAAGTAWTAWAAGTADPVVSKLSVAWFRLL